MNKSEPNKNVNLTEFMVYRHVRSHRGHRSAMMFGDSVISYNEVAARVSSTSSFFSRQGISSSDLVVLLVPDCPAFVTYFFGIIGLNAIALPINPKINYDEIAQVVDHVNAKAIIIHENFIGKFEPLKNTGKNKIFISDDFFIVGEQIETGSPVHIPEPVSSPANSIAYCLLSSGTTGRAKVITHAHTDILFYFSSYAIPVLGMNENSRVLAVSKLSFGYALGGSLLFGFSAGGTIILFKETTTAEIILRLSKELQPTIFLATPRIISELLRNFVHQKRFVSIQIAVSAGEPLSKDLYYKWKEQFHIPLLDGFGSTEMGHIFITNTPADIHPGSLGKPIPGIEMRIINDNEEDVGMEEIGQLIAAGPPVTRYYWNDPGRTAQSIKGNWLYTNDLFYRNASGYFFYMGRKDDIIKVGCGEWIHPLEIENCIMGNKDVLQCAVIGAKYDDVIKLKALVVLKKNTKITVAFLQNLKMLVADKWPELEYKHLAEIEIVSDLPRNAVGKINRTALKSATLTDLSYDC